MPRTTHPSIPTPRLDNTAATITRRARVDIEFWRAFRDVPARITNARPICFVIRNFGSLPMKGAFSPDPDCYCTHTHTHEEVYLRAAERHTPISERIFSLTKWQIGVGSGRRESITYITRENAMRMNIT